MEPIFENKYIRDKETAKEISAFLYLKRPLSIVVGILCAFCFVVHLTFFILGYEYSVLGFILLPTYIAYKLYCYFVSKNSFIKRDAEISKGDIVITTEIYEDCLTVKVSNGSVVELEYDKIKKISLTKNYILIISKARLIYVLKKDSFTKGSFSEFIEYIKNKGIKI